MPTGVEEPATTPPSQVVSTERPRSPPSRSPALRYFVEIGESRYFWIHLSLSDLRARWRRSFLGAVWSLIQPLAMTGLLAFVFGRVFHVDTATYAPFIFSGMILWEYIVSTATGGSLSFVQADAYIKQARRPLAIYPLRTALTNLCVLGFASIGLVGWVLLAGLGTFGWTWLAAPLVYPIALGLGWTLATFLAYFATRFRDIPHALGLVLQVAWFVSPVYFEPKLFRDAGLNALVDANPIYHYMQIVRAPLLHGEWPTTADFAYSLGTIGALACLAALAGRHMERRIIFYL